MMDTKVGIVKWTRQLHDAMRPEAASHKMDVYHLVEMVYEAWFFHGESYNVCIRFRSPQKQSLFVLKYGHLL